MTDYSVTKVSRGPRGGWVYARPLRFKERETALKVAQDAVAELRAFDRPRRDTVRIVVTQGATMVREFKV